MRHEDFEGFQYFLNNPEYMVANRNMWKSALFSYMTPQNPTPSMHDIVTGLWIPSLNEINSNFGNTFGTTVFVLRKYSACGGGFAEDAEALERADYYAHFLDALGAEPENLSNICRDMNQNWPNSGLYTYKQYIQKDYIRENECEFVSYKTKFNIFVKDDYKRCVCATWGAGESDCPQDTSCTWTETTQTESTKILNLSVYAGTTAPFDLVDNVKN